MNGRNGLNCRTVKRLLIQRMDGPLSPDRLASLTAHVEGCPSCRTLADRLEHQAALLRSGASMVKTETGFLATRAVSQRAAAKTPAAHRFPPRALPWATAAASVAVLTVVAVRHHSSAPEVAMLKPASVTTPRKQRLTTVVPPPRTRLVTTFRPPIAPPHRTIRPGKAVPAVPPISVPMPEAARDDLAYLNETGGSENYIRRWGHLSPSQSEKLQAEIDHTVQMGDDFVSVPFPQVAMAGPKARVAASEAIRRYRQEKAVVDPRLLRKITLAEKGIAFSDLCTHLTAETGISFTAGRTVADDKVSLFCKDRPLRDIMRAVTRLFNFSWERDGKDPEFRYVLFQPVRAQLAEEEMRNHDRNEALAELDRQMDRFRSHLDLTPDQAKTLAVGATGDDKRMYDALAGSGWGAAHLYFGLSSEQLASLQNGDRLSFKGAGEMPGDIGQGVLSALRDTVHFAPHASGVGYEVLQDPKAQGMTAASAPGVNPYVQLSLQSDELGQFSLVGDGGFLCSSGKGNSYGYLHSDAIAQATSPSTHDPKNAEANELLKSDPTLKEGVRLTAAGEKAKTDTETAKRITSADILEAFHKATGRDVIGDYYTRLYDPNLIKPESAPIPLFALLCRVCDTARLRWNKDDDWLTFRSAGFFNDRPKEVPARLLTRWSAARKENHDQLSINSLCEIATLTDIQLNANATAEGIKALYGLEEWNQIRSGPARESWRLLAALTPDLRRIAMNERDGGIRFEQLSPDRQEQFARAALGKNFTVTGAAEKMVGASLQVHYEPPVPAQPADPVKGLAAVPAKPADFKFTYLYNYSSDGPCARKQVTPNGTSISDPGKAPKPRGNEPAKDAP